MKGEIIMTIKINRKTIGIVIMAAIVIKILVTGVSTYANASEVVSTRNDRYTQIEQSLQ